MLRRQAASPLPVSRIILAKFLFSVALGLVVMLTLAGTGLALGWISAPRDPLAALLLGLALAAELLDAPLPESVVERIKTEQKIPELVRHVQHRIFHDPRPGDQLLDHQRFRLRIRERLRDRIPMYRHLISAPLIKLFVPNRKDIELVEIPGAPFMMYYLIRPFRLARRLWSRTLHGKNTAS